MRFPNNRQLLAFGAITHYYASAESGIKIVLAGMLEIDLAEFLILTEPHSSLDLRNVAKSIAKHRFKQTPEIEQFRQIVGDLGSFGALRNNIAHSRWSRGSRRNSIKPFRIDIRSGVAKFHGAEEEECDWTTGELIAEADKLIRLNRRITQLLVDTGIAARMAANDEARSDPIEASEGSSTKAS